MFEKAFKKEVNLPYVEAADQKETAREIDNVRFKEAAFLNGAMASNCKVGYHNCSMRLDKGGVWFEFPKTSESQAFLAFVPMSNIKQIEFKV